jgi:glycosyltransferase involved in cell wall biosynthesis
MRLGIIARSDNTGLGNQTRNLVNMLEPDKILLIDSTPFNENKQHPDWYSGYDCITTNQGFATREEIVRFLDGLDVVLTCESFYSSMFLSLAHKRNVKTILQYNYEFLDLVVDPNQRMPSMLLSPSVWNIDHVEKVLGNLTKVVYLPPPIDPIAFSSQREINMFKTHNRILHIAGKFASKDRNGTSTVIDMLKYSNADYELVIKSQTPIETDCNDPRLTIDVSNTENYADLYSGYDAMVLPRRYAGLCLPMNEALMSALPVFMTDISPNNFILPGEWLIGSEKIDRLLTRMTLDVYGADPIKLAIRIDDYVNNVDKEKEKKKAYDIGMQNFYVDTLKDKYLSVINDVVS